MQEILLLKCGELVLKGLNRYRFEEKLVTTVRRRLKPLGEYSVSSSQSIIYVEPAEGAPLEPALAAAKKIFGIVSVSRAAVCEKTPEGIMRVAGEYLRETFSQPRTFKVEARRADKRFPLTSPQIGAEVGGYLHDMYPHLTPKMDDPDVLVRVEVREKYAFVSAGRTPGAGGIPTGTAGRAMLLLSGGIDSPVAGYMMAKRGLELGAVHFFSYPYTSMEAKQKVLDLAEILAGYCGKITVSVVPFTEIQTAIRANCSEDYFTIIMRRMMMRIAQQVAERQNCSALITGESLGQVASQTLQSLCVTDAVCEMPVFRPLIGMDKDEIVTVSQKIGTFETSILPYEDCCTVFTPKHPQTKPRPENVLKQEEALDVETLVNKAVENTERITLG